MGKKIMCIPKQELQWQMSQLELGNEKIFHSLLCLCPLGYKGGLGRIFDRTSPLKEIRRLKENHQPPEMQEWQ